MQGDVASAERPFATLQPPPSDSSYSVRPPRLDHLHREAILDYIATHELPLKYAYAGSASLTHNELANSITYQDTVGSAHYEASSACTSFSSGLPQVVEVGPGNGRHTVAFLENVAQLGFRVERYFGLDFSIDLLKMTCDRLNRDSNLSVSSDLPVCDVAWWDLEDGPTDLIEFWRNGPAPALVCVLGQTLGNVENPADALTNLSKSLRSNDQLLLGLAPRFDGAGPDRYLAPYRSAVFRRAALEPMRQIGIPDAAMDLQLEYTNNTVIGKALITRSVVCNGVTLEAGHVVRCFLSRRFNAKMVTALLVDTGWDPVSIELDNDGSHLVATATRI